ncbi:GcrA family cell cycle regulator [Methylorubrum rhodesianum]|jgi:GcrA cell cycle regulator|uniref:GcrA family cell cycle regulator n=1 Tax=Methylorubrum rhodesianum TaxID=29427 RepID=A0ABU9ZJG3_9HYPH|nr:MULTISPECIES: GcrA family cell cycle regulator [Methylorubrum]MBB5764215.1 GcrA cell cycle regulator [Methylorubrum rhodesianum]MBI1690091.1 GcrA cell cycle regulator [Methylorubrum sp. DB1722]MBK3406006.1 GcrA cell cycle regulator [Methylorubrum rhodesianum]MBY0141428.1 GcrA cell cycle regulator [Methylorubrum populi]
MTEAVPSWTDERVELLRRLWDDGLSASQIALQIGGVSRNAVIGKVHRLGLAGRVKPIGPAAAQGRRKDDLPAEVEVETLVVEEPTLPEPPAIVAHRPAPNFPLRPSPAPEPVALAVSERVTIMDLRDSMCRWPMGDPTSPEFRFCGARSITGLPYCTQHAQVAYQPAAERKRDRRVAGFR